MRSAFVSESAETDPWTLELLPQFLDLTARRQIDIDIQRGNLESGHEPLLALREIASIVHNIAGTAANFGLAGLGRQARIVDTLCGQICTLSGPARDEAVTTRLFPALDTLSREFDSALAATA